MFKNNCYAKVWGAKRVSDKAVAVKISISRKEEDGTYTTTFSSGVLFVGDALNKIGEIKKGDFIKILSCGVTNNYDKENKEQHVRYFVFDFEIYKKAIEEKTSKKLF